MSALDDLFDRWLEDHRVRPPVRTDTPPSEAGVDELSEGSAPAPDHPPLSGEAGEIPGSEGFPGAGGTPAPVAAGSGSAPGSAAPQEQERTKEVCPTCGQPIEGDLP